MQFRALCLFFLFAFFQPIHAQQTLLDTLAAKQQQQWVDSIFNKMDDDERLGQLFMVAAFSNKNAAHVDEIENLISKNGIGGVIFFQGGPVRQALLTNRYQARSKVPLFVAMDAEWGLGMRLDKDSVMSFPKQMTLGAIQDNTLIYRMGEEIASQCKRLGVHINFAPVVDINNNPANPVIGVRSFGENKEQVTAKALAYMKGMQHHRIMACAKHFPGHGDVDADSHLSLPVIKHSKERFNEIELYPFKRLIADSLQSVMIAHLYLPAFDSTKNRASTVSKAVVTDLLRAELNFKGLAFTDALNMKGVSSFYKPGEVDLAALIAGNDVLVYSQDVPLAIKKIKKAIKEKDISKEDIYQRIKKILSSKYWAGLSNYKPVNIDGLVSQLNSSTAKSLQLALYAKAVTVVSNKDSVLPIRVLDTTSIATLSIGLTAGNPFETFVDKYAPSQHFSISKIPEDALVDSMLNLLNNYDVVLIGLHGTSSFNNKDYGISENAKRLISLLEKRTVTILTVFGNPYALRYFTDSPRLICAYEDNETTQRLIPQLIFGGIPSVGRLPVTAAPMFAMGTGLQIQNKTNRLSFAYPENAQMDSETLKNIDTLIGKAIVDGATPGCQVLVAKDGMVVYNKSFGNLMYDKLQPVNDNTLYDIASISKVAGTLQAVMFLEERGLINIEKNASFYLPELKKTNKEDLKIKDILTHQAGLIPFIPYWKKTLDSLGFMKNYYCSTSSDTFCREVIPGLYSIKSVDDTLWKWSIESDLLKKPKKLKNYEYVYSDIGFYIMKRIVESLINQPMEDFLRQNFYDPLGLTTMSYRPLLRFPIERIAPTEDDKTYRKALIRGTVHDQGAALLGGVAGHAGLFSNAHDLAILMQMNLNGGSYGGQRMLQAETLAEFTEKQFATNRRGLGWDKPEPAGGGPTSEYASSATFGHTGFTGTAAWADPDHNLIYIFLSNRVYPDAANNKLVKYSIRTKVQDYIYKSIVNYR